MTVSLHNTGANAAFLYYEERSASINLPSDKRLLIDDDGDYEIVNNPPEPGEL